MDIKIGGYPLDKEQFKIATADDKELLVVAGAGSGKTFTIVGRIWYLINVKKLSLKKYYVFLIQEMLVIVLRIN